MLRQRAALLQRLRGFFDERGFVEVETPLLSADAVVDAHLDPIPVTLFADAKTPSVGETRWLQTSPEFAMKRLLAAGAERIYQVGKAFRAGERGALHNPEFTMVEWYRVGDSLQAGMDLLAELACTMLPVDDVGRVSYEVAFGVHVGLNPHSANAQQLAERAAQMSLRPPESLGENKDAWLNYLLAECVEPNLGCIRPVIVFDYPASQAALSRVRRTSEGYDVAERFELYCEGVELANGYHELTDPEILRQRNRSANVVRVADGRYAVPEQSRLLTAMDHGLPSCSGVALGFDRLVMVATGVKTLAEVMAFPIDRA
jgi:lysyl-tRNA synthetase class 2